MRFTRFALAAVGAHALAVSAARAQAPTDSSVRAYTQAEATRLMQRMDIPGAVVVITRHDQVIMNAAFGVADRERRVPVDTANTVFRVASVAKVFTAAAALRLVRDGRVGLTQDLRPLLPDVLGGLRDPITLHQLLTHTSGLDEQLIGYLNPPGTSEALAACLTRQLPPRGREAGTEPAYSNHGYGLVGLVDERLTRVPFDAWVRDSLFRPLGMSHSSFLLTPGDGTPGLAREYRSDGTRRVWRSSRAFPAGNVGTTATDMRAFLSTLLVAARGADTTDPIGQLVRPALTYSADLPPMGYGMSGVPIAGRTVWMKGGASPSHSAVIAVMPDADVAIFIAVNRQEPLFWNQLVPDLVRRFWPGDDSTTTISSGALPRIDGDYRWTRAPLGSNEKLLGLATQLRVSRTRDGILVQGPIIGGTYSAQSPTRFRDSTGRVIAFRVGATGAATYAFAIEAGQPVSFERIGLSQTTRVQLVALALGMVLVIVAGVSAAKGRVASPAWARAAVIALPVVVVATIASAIPLGGQSDSLLEGPTGWLRAAEILATITGVIALAQSVGNGVIATRPGVTVTRRMVHWAGGLGGLAVLWFLADNRLLGSIQ